MEDTASAEAVLGRLIRMSVLLYRRVQVYGLGEFWLNEGGQYAWVGFRWRPSVPTSGVLLRLLEQSQLSASWLDRTVQTLKSVHKEALWFTVPYLGTFGVVNGEWFLLEPEVFPSPAWGGTLFASLPSAGIGQPALHEGVGMSASASAVRSGRMRSFLLASLVVLVFLGLAGLVLQLWWWSGGDWQKVWVQWKTFLTPAREEGEQSVSYPPDSVLQQVHALLRRYGGGGHVKDSLVVVDTSSQAVDSDLVSSFGGNALDRGRQQLVDSIQYLPGYYVVVASARRVQALRLPQKFALWLHARDSVVGHVLKVLRRRGGERVRLAIGPMDRRSARTLADSLRQSGVVPDAWVLYWRDSVLIWVAGLGKR